MVTASGGLIHGTEHQEEIPEIDADLHAVRIVLAVFVGVLQLKFRRRLGRRHRHNYSDTTMRPRVSPLVDLIALVLLVADGNAQQRLGIEELEKAGGKSVGGIVDIGGSDGSVGANQAKIAIGPLSLGAIQGAGETLYVGTFQAS